MLEPLRLRTAVPVVLAALALPAQAAAHGRGATIALDYRLALDPSVRALPGVHVRVLDGDRDLQVSADRGVRLVVLGALREPLLRIDSSGVWVNASSPTATGDRLVSSSRSAAGCTWTAVGPSSGTTTGSLRRPRRSAGPAGRFTVPVAVNGHPAAISGTFFRVARPAAWPWALASVGLVAGIVLAVRRRALRGALTVGLGVASGLAALVLVTTFAVRDSPTGGVAWLQLVAAIAVAGVLGVLLLRLRGRSRVHAAGVVGAVAAAVSLSSLPVFWHGAVISLLPGTLARVLCLLAVAGGACGRRAQLPARLRRAGAGQEAAAAMRRLLVLVATLPPSVHPWPVGPAPAYTPPARPVAVVAGAPLDGLRCGAAGATFRVHLEVFVDRKVVIVPAGIGVSDKGCRYPVSHRTPRRDRPRRPGPATRRRLSRLGPAARRPPARVVHVGGAPPRLRRREALPRPARRDPVDPACPDRRRARRLRPAASLLSLRRR